MNPTTLTAVAAWLNQTFSGMDHAAAQFANALHQGALGGFFDWFLSFITFFGDKGWAFFATGLILMCFKKTRKLGMATFGAVVIGAIITNLTIKDWVARPRPYADQASDFYQWWLAAGAQIESEFSFPSGHSTAASAGMCGLFFALGKGKKRALLLIVPLLIAFSRVYLVVHYASDVLAGLLIGLFAGYVASLLVNWFARLLTNRRSPLAKKLFAE